jgi:hypothetical protein
MNDHSVSIQLSGVNWTREPMELNIINIHRYSLYEYCVLSKLYTADCIIVGSTVCSAVPELPVSYVIVSAR